MWPLFSLPFRVFRDRFWRASWAGEYEVRYAARVSVWVRWLLVPAESSRLPQQARRLAEDCSLLTIDGPPGITRTSAEAVRAADLVLIPPKASPFDVWASSDIVAAVKARQENSRGAQSAAFVITMTRPRTILGRQIDQALADYDLPTLKARATERVSYPQAAIEGLSVLETRDQTARNEVLAIRGEVERLLHHVAR